MSSESMMVCPLEGVLGTISRKWAILVVNYIGNADTARFKGMMQKLTGINPKTLTCRLRELQKAGLIDREAFAEVPPRVEYTLTEAGRELQRALVPLMEWFEHNNPDLHIGDTPCHRAFAQLREA